MIIERRSILKGLVALVVAPAIVKVASLMPVNAALQPGYPNYLTLQETTREAVRRFTDCNEWVKQIDEQYRAEIKFMNGEQWLEADGTGTLAKGERLSGTEINALYREQFAVDGAKIGSQLRIRLPQDCTVMDGPALDLTHPNDAFTYAMLNSDGTPWQARENRVPTIPAPLAFAAAAVAIAPAVLKTPVTRRFWSK